MSRTSLTWPRRNRSVWDRSATDTRLLPTPLSNSVSLTPSIFPSGRTAKTSAPSRLLPSGVTLESQVPLPLHRTVDARASARKDPTCAQRGVRMDACLDSPQMFPRLPLASAPLRRGCLPRLAADVSPQLTPLRAFPSAVDARAFARMYFRSAVPGVAKIACANVQAIPHAPTPDAPANTAEGALATSSLYTVIPAEAGIHPSKTLTFLTPQLTPPHPSSPPLAPVLN